MTAIENLRKGYRKNIIHYLEHPVSIAPLVFLRIAFGAVMFFSIIRFILNGWVEELYILPKFYFPYYGFEWVQPLGETGMYSVFGILGVSSLLVMLGLFYRVSITTFFIIFTYVELIDKSNYLNHYYFVSIISFLLILVPAHRSFSIDTIRKPSLKITSIPVWIIGIFKLQMVIVYLYAGIAKLNYDWLMEALPLKIWLPAHADMPVIGSLLDELWVAYFFSWFGAVYDLTIPFFLLNRKTRSIAYIFVIIFHLATALFFQIGMFPYIMIVMTLIFFSEGFHYKNLSCLKAIFKSYQPQDDVLSLYSIGSYKNRILLIILSFYFLLQVLVPFRFLLYPGKFFWTEQGYRFSWRVMLMEKGGTAFFYVKDPETGKQCEVTNCDYLTPNQEKMMSTQPDMILQFAHFLKEEYKRKGIKDPVINVESYVTLNGRGSRLFIDSNTDLSKEEESFLPKSWILPFNENKPSDK
ncbi:MAG: HTTM domain-containing protein [Cytophagaceae bacterium]|nr:HTTM domain-containing protein [Cytophagaceae bacterium]